MTHQEDNTMNKLMILASICLCLVVLVSAAFADHDMSITVTGSGSVSAAPDLMSISANITCMNADLSAAQNEVNHLVHDLRENLVRIGLKGEDIVTTSYTCSTIYDYSSTPYTLTGYQANHTLFVTCRSLDKIDDILDAMTNGGHTEIYNMQFDISNKNDLYLEALSVALSAAEDKAMHLAKSAGFTTCSIEKITEESAVLSPNYAKTRDAAAAGSSSGIYSGPISIEAEVTVTFEAK